MNLEARVAALEKAVSDAVQSDNRLDLRQLDIRDAILGLEKRLKMLECRHRLINYKLEPAACEHCGKTMEYVCD